MTVEILKERKGGQCLCEALVKTARDGEVWRDERGGRRKTEISAGVMSVSSSISQESESQPSHSI